MKLKDLCKEHERDSQVYLDKSKPVLIRLDGRGFSKLTKRMKKPVCPIMQKAMQDTLRYLLENIQGTIVGYQQSDEMTIVIDGYTNENSQLFYGGRTDKILSVSSSMATWYFNKRFLEIAKDAYLKIIMNNDNPYDYNDELLYLDDIISYADSYKFKAMFDCRVFQCEKEEITNMIRWRQIDCEKNSVSSYCHKYFSYKELYEKNTKTRKNMLLEKGIDWEKENFVNKYGYVLSLKTGENGRQKFVETNIYFGKNQDIYSYIEKRVSI